MNYTPPITSEVVSTIPSGIVRHVHCAATPLGKPFGILEILFDALVALWELTPCIFYIPQVLGLLDSWYNPIYTVFKVPMDYILARTIVRVKAIHPQPK